MNPIKIIQKYYKVNSRSYQILVGHSRAVANKALKISRNVARFNPNLCFIEEAAMMHDIGIFQTHAPEIDCFGDKPYICHGYLGRKILDKEGFPRHALVCERHIGVGLSIQDIEKYKLSIPKRNMLSISIEEEIVSFADLFYSKDTKSLTEEKNIDMIRKKLLQIGAEKVQIFDGWINKFGY